MRRTVTDTADRLRTCDLLTLDSDLRAQTRASLDNVVLVEDIAACITHGGCLAVAVTNPHGGFGDQPDAVLHIPAGYVLTWTGDYRFVNCAGHRPGGVDLTVPAVGTTTADADIAPNAAVAHPRTGRPTVVHRVDRTLTTIGVRYADDTYAVYPRTAA